MMGGSYQVYADIEGDTKKREHIEGAQNFERGQEIIKYVKARLPATDRVWGEFGARQTGTREFDYTRLREAVNEPVAE